MFTGIVQALGIVIGIADSDAGKRLTVSLAELAGQPIKPGDSVCVSGVCLTAVKIGNGNAVFDVITETLKRSSLGSKTVGGRVNLELSLRPDSFLGGHFVQGHVDAVGRVTGVQAEAKNWRITIEIPAEFVPMVVPKGSVAIDGVSMTIAETAGKTFTVAVIPTTLEMTTLSGLKTGDPINVETDIIARTVVHTLMNMAQGGGETAKMLAKGVTLEKLREQGLA